MAHSYSYQSPSPQQYPSYPPKFNSTPPMASSTDFDPKAVEEARGTGRTPSPTPSEEYELSTGALDWKGMLKWRFWIRKEWLWYYVGFTIILVIAALVTIYHAQIVTWLTPFTKWLHGLKFGWLVPIGILFVISFPPLFGHEIVAMLCGLVWGLWIGFGIVAAGTFIGEVGNFYAFKYCCRARGEKLEKTKIPYACLAKVIRDGGFRIALIARLSAIPGHFTTAIFSTCGMNIFVFSIAAILSLPKQFITVYLGVILEQSAAGPSSSQSSIIKYVVLAVTFLITIVAMWYIFHQMSKVKPEVIYARRKARQRKLSRGLGDPLYSSAAANDSTDSTVGFNPNASETDFIPLADREPGETRYQQWDKHGRAVGYAPDPNLYAPKPQRPMSGYGGRNSGGGGAGVVRQSTTEVGWDTGMGEVHQRNVAGTKSPPEAVTAEMAAKQNAVTYDAYQAYQQGAANRGLSTSPQAVNPTPYNRSAAYDTATPPPIAPPPGSSTTPRSQPQHAQSASYPNPYDNANPYGGMHADHPTPTQTSFVNFDEPKSPFDDPVDDAFYGPEHGRGHGHGLEPTDSTFRTAMTGSPEPMDQKHSSDNIR